MRVLYLTHRVPFAPNRGDRIRAYHTLRFLRAEGVEVHLVAFAHDDHEAVQTAALDDMVTSYDIVRLPRARNLCRAALSLSGSTPLTHLLLDSPEVTRVLHRCRTTFAPDRVLAYCSGMARFAMAPPLAGLPFVLDMVDVDSLKWASLAEQTSGPRRWIYRREARLLGQFEVEAIRAATATLVVSDREAEALAALDGTATANVVPNGVDAAGFHNPCEVAAGAGVVFSGVFSYEPNETAALWLMEEVWPRVIARRPDARLTLVGASPGARLRKVASSRGVEVTGTVDDVRPYLWRAAVAVAPLSTARGVQNKVLEAVAAGLPVVVTPAVFQGLPSEVLPACRAAAAAEAFADAVGEWLDAPSGFRRELVARADVAALSWPERLAPLRGILEG